jgi:hypothetical protein
MSDVFRMRDNDGNETADWAYYSESKGEIVNVGQDEAKARELATNDSPTTTIQDVLANDTASQATNSQPSSDSNSSDNRDSVSDTPSVAPRPVALAPVIPPVNTPPKKSAFSPAMLKKIVETAGKNSTNITIEFERFMFKQFGYTTQELAENDDDVEMVRLGWDCLWNSYLENKEPPIGLILLFGYSCVTMRLIASAKKMPKKEVIDVPTT